MAVDWGTVPEWIGALSTGAALIIALVVFSRDRNDRLSETARRVHVSYLEDQTVLVRNDGFAPVRDVRINVRELILDAEPGRVLGFILIDDVQPNTEHVLSPQVDEGSTLPRLYSYALDFAFIDADGRAWHRDWRGKLTRTR